MMVGELLHHLVPARVAWIALFISLALVVFTAQPARAAGVVGGGAPAGCTESALDAALIGGGLISFDCGPAPYTLTLSAIKQISDDTEIDGGNLITLSGGNTTSHFQVFSGKTLTLRKLTLTRGNGTYGSIENFGELHIIDSYLLTNTATTNAGAIENYGVLSLENSVLAGNRAHVRGGAIHNDSGSVTVTASRIGNNSVQDETGGGIWSNGTLTVTNTTLADNHAAYDGGGGIYNDGGLRLTGVTFKDNTVSYAGPANGGGLHHAGGNATLNDVVFDGNTSNTYGGGLFVRSGSLSASDALFIHNDAVAGGAVSNSGVFTLTNSLVFSNTAQYASGVLNGGAGVFVGVANIAALINVTVSENLSSAMSGGSVESDDGVLTLLFATVVNNQGNGVGRGSAANQLQLKNTIVAYNSPKNCFNNVFSNGFNIVDDNSCSVTQPSDRGNTDPLLGPLTNNGGPLHTYMPKASSPAIDGGQCVANVTTDQRGALRPRGAACDVGAVEADSAIEYKLRVPLLLK